MSTERISFHCLRPGTHFVHIQSRKRYYDLLFDEIAHHAELAALEISILPLPDQQSGEKFATFTYHLHNDAQNPICGTAHHVASPEMLYVSDGSGAQFDERASALRGGRRYCCCPRGWRINVIGPR